MSQIGYVILDNPFSKILLENLEHRAHGFLPADWQQAGIGRKNSHKQDKAIRSDNTHWISDDNSTEAAFLQCMDTLRIGLNQRLFLGLFNYEGHFSRYLKGASYQKHIDAHKGKSSRVLSQILYLNSDWKKSDAGELVMFFEKDVGRIQTVAPNLGTFVLFLSNEFPHEVLEANRSRFSLTGWFHKNNVELG